MPIVKASARDSRRYHDLIVAFGVAAKHHRGWKLRAATLLAIDATYLSKILRCKGAQQIGRDQVLKAVRRFPVLRDYFLGVTEADAVLPQMLGTSVQAAIRKRSTTADEFDVMRAIDALDVGARARVKAWLDARERGEVT